LCFTRPLQITLVAISSLHARHGRIIERLAISASLVWSKVLYASFPSLPILGSYATPEASALTLIPLSTHIDTVKTLTFEPEFCSWSTRYEQTPMINPCTLRSRFVI
jgi:hypothetical protein